MPDQPIAPADIEGVASRLEHLRDQFSDHEYDTLGTVFRLAGIGFKVDAPAADAPEVTGYAITPDKPETGSENVRRATLSAQFSLGLGLTPAAPSPVPLPYPNLG